MSLVVRLRGEGTWVGLGRWGIGSSLRLRLLSVLSNVTQWRWSGDTNDVDKRQLTVSWITVVWVEMIWMDRSRGDLRSRVRTHLIRRIHPLLEHVHRCGRMACGVMMYGIIDMKMLERGVYRQLTPSTPSLPPTSILYSRKRMRRHRRGTREKIKRKRRHTSTHTNILILLSISNLLLLDFLNFDTPLIIA